MQDVLNFYVSGVRVSPTLDPLLMQNDQPGISLTLDERNKIIDFLKTLTDEEFLSDRRFSEY